VVQGKIHASLHAFDWATLKDPNFNRMSDNARQPDSPNHILDFQNPSACCRMKPTDKELLLACRRGEESAWEALVNRYQRLMYAIPRRAGLDDDRAAEVFQEVFTTLFQKLNDIDDPDRLHAWLVTTAKRKTWRLISKDRLTGQMHREDDEDGAEKELARIADDSPLPDEALLKLEEQHRVRTALGDLEERCRNLLTMLFYQSETPSYSEIAVSLGISEGSIGPTRARCLEKMLRLLDK
jgi:RNA polymerase sigma factor (sigma-70 family)